MSRKLCVQFEVRSMLIMKDTLKQMGIDYNEINDHQIECSQRYNNIAINSDTGNIAFDSDDQNFVDGIKQNYTVNFYKDRAIREGMKLKEERTTNGEVVLTLLR